MSDATLNIDFNIKIRVIDDKGKLVEERHIHNKATRNLVDGIVQFLQGNFNPSQFNDPYDKYASPIPAIINNAYSAKRYLPSCTGVGKIGVDTTGHTLALDYDLYAKPTFFDTGLQQEIDVPRIKFRRMRQTRGLDVNNSEGIVMTTVLPKGYLVVEYDNDGQVIHDDEGNVVYRSDYFDYYGPDGTNDTPVRAMAITEVGLFSNTDTTDGLLLARVLLDGHLSSTQSEAQKGVMADKDYEYNPLIQAENTSVVIEWKIGVYSIGTNDNYVVEMEDPDIEIVEIP